MDDTLLEDVRKYAAELGFGGGQSGGEFSDFAPTKAKKKIKKAKVVENDEKGDGERERNGRGSKDGKKNGAREKQSNREEGKKKTRKDGPVESNHGNQEWKEDYTSSKGERVLGRKNVGYWWDVVSGTGTRMWDGRASKGHTDANILKQQAQDILSTETRLAKNASSSSKDTNFEWLEKTRQAGTTSDKVAAMALLVQEAPFTNLSSLEGLLNMIYKRGGARAVVGSALDALNELWRDVLLPPDRKLRYFEQQPFAQLPSGKEGSRLLLSWIFEDSLKSNYASFVEALARLSTDNLDFIKEKAIKVAFDLLVSRPEQEHQLLRLVVNKLGDPNRKVASNAGYLLTKLVSNHSGMKYVVVREVENFMYRPGLTDRARYYGVVYLNQIVLSKNDDPVTLPDGSSSSLGKKLVDLYFTLFKLIMDGSLGTAASITQASAEKMKSKATMRAAKRGKKKAFISKIEESSVTIKGDRTGEMDSRMLSALITGIRRCFPFVLEDEIQPLVEAHSGEYNTMHLVYHCILLEWFI